MEETLLVEGYVHNMASDRQVNVLSVSRQKSCKNIAVSSVWNDVESYQVSHVTPIHVSLQVKIAC